FDGDFFPDVPPYLLLGILGKDTVTGTGPYTHSFALLTTGLPPSFTLSDYNGYEERQFAGMRVEQLDLKYSLDGALEYSAKLLGKKSATATTTTPTFGTVPPFLAWQCAVTIGGVSVPRVAGWDMTLQRKSEVLFAANNSQDPRDIFVGPLQVTGKMTAYFEDNTELTHFLSNDQPAVVITLTQDANTQMTITMSKCAFSKAAVNRSKDYVMLDMEFEAVHNPTDNGPCTVAVKNAVPSY
ncbi:MAG: phage tail tube protein, partial [Sphaerobacter sp.]|nr:phage tail tube protein [Sphaerobacter sp.]